ncbi:hypothetical protein [Streptomyces sp. NRRL S-495]|uniref:hypothetical protein n=1 Tax=Streptomyces sp. NRRL S-495 TaxID=1609133 RepID=UPI001331A508|nr:hypothetical protein [Streptomyces sp. NRRL S-495]
MISAVIASAVAFLIAWKITEGNNDRRIEVARNTHRERLDENEKKAIIALRHELVDDVAQVVSVWYLCLQYERARQGEFGRRVTVSDFKQIHDQYAFARTSGSAIQLKLQTFFNSPDLSKNWHAVMDLISVRYYAALGRLTTELKANNATSKDEYHSGLNVEQLAEAETVKNAYADHLDAVMADIISSDLLLTGYSPKAFRGTYAARSPR